MLNYLVIPEGHIYLKLKKKKKKKKSRTNCHPPCSKQSRESGSLIKRKAGKGNIQQGCVFL